MGLGKLFGRGKDDDDQGIGIPGAGEAPLTPAPMPVPAPQPSAEVHVTSQTFDVSDNPQAGDAVVDMLKAQGIDISAMTGGATIQMGQPMDPADAERYRQNMLGMLDSMGIQAPPAAFQPVPGAGGPPAPGDDPGVDDVVESLERLAKLRDSGVLTDAEFDAQKARILGGGA